MRKSHRGSPHRGHVALQKNPPSPSRTDFRWALAPFPAILSAAALLAVGITLGSFQTHGSSATGQMDSNLFVELAKRAVPSVVNISTISTVKTPYLQGSQDDLFRRFFEEYLRNHGGDDGGGGDESEGPDQDSGEGESRGGKLPKAMSLGSGFIIDSSGLILTNNHVVVGADEIKIQFTEEADEKPTDGVVVGRDPEIDVALIRVKNKRQMIPLPLGDSDHLEVGEYVIAVGNPFGEGHSVTHGIISAKGRLAPDFPLANYLQTDAPINPGNSGGPLVNIRGEVIGINNAIEQRAQGIGFAIPISLVKRNLEQLKTKGTVSYGFLGVLVEALTPELASKLGAPRDLQAPFVTHISPGGPADKAGLKDYDIITDFNGKKVRSEDDLINAVSAAQVGSSVPVRIIRNGRESTLKVRIGQRPPEQEEGTKNGKKGDDSKVKPMVPTGMTVESLASDSARDLGMPSDAKGVVVNHVSPGSPADEAGLLRNDVIIEVDRKPVVDVAQFYSVVKEKKSYLLRVRRLEPEGDESYTVVILDLGKHKR